MTKSQLYKLFLNFIGGESIEIEGLYLKPERILRDDNTIEFSIQNPNNISYYLGAIEEYLNDILFNTVISYPGKWYYTPLSINNDTLKIEIFEDNIIESS